MAGGSQIGPNNWVHFLALTNGMNSAANGGRALEL